ncbi:uncharacterized protein [Typha latifolia]|uniref:uncharacterized protein isoform X2 n=1 Tax=Typha latifolia TaxID=4733 RepID=UPI003C2E946D
MAEEEKKKPAVPPRYDLDAKWNACLDIAIRRLVYSSVAGGFSGLLFFRSPTTRWASVAFGAGVGIGAAYTECSYLFDSSPPKWSPKVSASPASSQGTRCKQQSGRAASECGERASGKAARRCYATLLVPRAGTEKEI